MANDEEKKGKKTSGGVRAFFRNLVGLPPAQSDLENTPQELKDGINAQVQQTEEVVVPFESNNDIRMAMGSLTDLSSATLMQKKYEKTVSAANLLLGGASVAFKDAYEQGLVVRLLQENNLAFEEKNGAIKLLQNQQLPKQHDLADKLKGLFANPGNAADNRPVLEAVNVNKDEAKVGSAPVQQQPVVSEVSSATPIPNKPSSTQAERAAANTASAYTKIMNLLTREIEAKGDLAVEASELKKHLRSENQNQREVNGQNLTGNQIRDALNVYIEHNKNIDLPEETKRLMFKLAASVMRELVVTLNPDATPKRSQLSPELQANWDQKRSGAAAKAADKEVNSIDELERDLDAQMRAVNPNSKSEEKTKSLENLFDDASLQVPTGARITEADLDKELAELKGASPAKAPSRPTQPSSDAMSNALYKAFDESKDDKQRGRLAEIMEFREKHSEYLADLREDFKDSNGESHSFDSLLSHKKVLEKEIQELQSKKDPLSRMLVADYKQKIIEVEGVAKEVFNKEIWKETGPRKELAAKSGLGSRQRQKDQKLKELKESGSTNISIQKVAALSGKENRDDIAPLLNNPADIQVKCPPRILKEFQKLVESAPKLLGAHFENPYTGKVEVFPKKAEEFTARHLQILARNEDVNVTGFMNRNKELYGDALTGDQVARLRCLVKATTVSGLVNVGIEGGFPKGKPSHKDTPEKMILIDQSGLQWQGDLRNTGGMFFYPNDMASVKIDNYAAWQSDMYKAMYGGDRPKEPSANNSVAVKWGGVEGKLDLTQVALGIQVEFLQALEAAGSIKDNDSSDKKVNLRYLKAGMGFFASGLTIEGKDGRDHPKLLGARLDGIEAALKYLQALPEAERKQILGNMGRLELPFSEGEQYAAKLQKIEELTKAIGIVWGGAGVIDALAAAPDKYINASTTGADPHAMPGNEGGYRSVDAMMSMNARIEHLNAAANQAMKLAPSVDFGQAMTDKISYALAQLRDSGESEKAKSFKGLASVLLSSIIPLNESAPNYQSHLKEAIKYCGSLLSDRKTTISDILEEVKTQLENNRGKPEEQQKILARAQVILVTLSNLNLSEDFREKAGLHELKILMAEPSKIAEGNSVTAQKLRGIEAALPEGDVGYKKMQAAIRVAAAFGQSVKEVESVVDTSVKRPQSVDSLMQTVGKGKIDQKNVEAMATDIMMNSTQRYLKIKEDDLYEKDWETGRANNNLRLMDEGINKITHNLVAVSVIKGTNNITEMVQRANFWVKVAEKLLEKGDYPSAAAICAVLQSAELPPSVMSSNLFDQKTLDNVNAQLNSEKNNKAYREAIANRKEYIPLTSISQQEILLNSEGNPRVDSKNNILNIYRLEVFHGALGNALSQTQSEGLLKSAREVIAPSFDLAAVLKEPVLTDKDVIAMRIAKVEIIEKGSLAAKGGQGSALKEVYGQLLQVGKRTVEVSIFEAFTNDKDRRQDKIKPEAIISTLLNFVEANLATEKTKNSEAYKINQGYAAGVIKFVEQYAKKNKVQVDEDTRALITKIKDEHNLKNAVIPVAVKENIFVSPTTVTPTVAQVQPVRPSTPPQNAGFKRAEPKLAGQEQPARVIGSAADAVIREDAKKMENSTQAEIDAVLDGLDDLIKKPEDEKKKGKKAKKSKDKTVGGFPIKDVLAAEAALGNFASMADLAKADVATPVTSQQASPETLFARMKITGEVASTEITYFITADRFFKEVFNKPLNEGELSFKEQLKQMPVKGEDVNHKDNFLQFLENYEKSIATSGKVIEKLKILEEFALAKQQNRAPVGLPNDFSPETFLKDELEPLLKTHMAVLEKCIEGYPGFLEAKGALSTNSKFDKIISEMYPIAKDKFKDQNFSLESIAITTVQRIPRYALLARELDKVGNTGFPPESDFATAASKANNTIRDADDKKNLDKAKEGLFNKIKNPGENPARKDYYAHLAAFLSQRETEVTFTDSELKIIQKNINNLNAAYKENNPNKGPNPVHIMSTSLIDQEKAKEAVEKMVSLGCSINIDPILGMIKSSKVDIKGFEDGIVITPLPEKFRSKDNLISVLESISSMKEKHDIKVNNVESKEFIAYLAMELNEAKASKKPDSYEQKLLEMSEKAFGQKFVEEIEKYAPENEGKDKEDKVSRRRRFGQTLGAMNPLKSRQRESQQTEPLAARPVTMNISEPVNVPMASNQPATLPIKPADTNDKEKIVEWASKVVDHYFKTGVPVPPTVDITGKVFTETEQLKLLVEAMATLKANGTVFNIPNNSSFITQLQDLGISHANNVKVMANVQILLTPTTPNLTATSSQPSAAVSANTQATPDKPKEGRPTFTVGSARLPSTTTPLPKVNITGTRTTPLTGFPLLLKNAQNAYSEYIKENRAKGYDSAVMKISSEMANMGMQFQSMSNVPLEQKSELYRKKLEELLTNPSPDAAGAKNFITEKLGNDLKVLPKANTLPQRPLPPQSPPPVQQQPVVPNTNTGSTVPNTSPVIPSRKPPSWMQRSADSNTQQTANLGSNVPKTASPQSGVSGDSNSVQPQQPRVASPSQPPVWSTRATTRAEVTQAFRVEGAHVDAFRQSSNAALSDYRIVSINPHSNRNHVEFKPTIPALAKMGVNVSSSHNIPSCVATFKPGEGEKPGATSYGMKPGTSFHSNESSALLTFLVKKAFDAHLTNPETKEKKLVITVLQDMGETKQGEFVKLIKEEAQRRIDAGALDKNNIAVNKAGELEPIPLDLKARANVARK